jgi:hypothetical protein
MRNSSRPRVRARLGAVPLAGVVATLAVTSLLETKPAWADGDRNTSRGI